MFPRNKPNNFTTFQNKHFEDGLTTEKFNLNSLKDYIEDIKFAIKMTHDCGLSTPEFPVTNKDQIYKDKSDSCKTNSPTIKLSKTFLQDLISKEKVCNPFWMKSSSLMSQKLWSTQKIDFVDSDFHYSDISLTNFIPSSQLSVIKRKQNTKNLLKTCWLLPQFSLPKLTDAENTIFSKKIRIYPTNSLKTFFKKCFGASRYVYNKGLEFIKNQYDQQIKDFKTLAEHGCVYKGKNNIQCCKNLKTNYFCEQHKRSKLKFKIDSSFISLRKKSMKNNKDFQINDEDYWLIDTPYDTRQLILKDLSAALKSCFTNLKRGNIKHFSLKYKSLKNNHQYFHINHKAINLKKQILFAKRHKQNGNNFKFNIRKKDKRFINNNVYKITNNCKISKDKRGYYYLCLFLNKNVYDNVTNRKEDYIYDSVFLDPGIRTFQTFYSPEFVAGKIGKNMTKILDEKLRRIDKLTELIVKCKMKRTRRNMRMRCLKLRTKIKNIISDLHIRSASWLCKHFKNIFIPTFETSQMSKKEYRNLNKKSVRNMLQLSHYKFRTKLEEISRWYADRKVILINESYTSKTCGNCEILNENLKGATIFTCSKCNYREDRDINGSRNMLIKILSDNATYVEKTK